MIHKEGKTIIINILINLLIINGIFYFIPINEYVFAAINFISVVFFGLILYFFRNPKRKVDENDNVIYAPADGKVVVIEQTQEGEYLKDKRIQISIFMSPLNVHVNRAPVSGEIKYYKYHPGNYKVAWHPKSSTENERTSMVIATPDGKEYMMRQIAGAVARRIVCYACEGNQIHQGDDIGFIKFGSRVDIYLPLDAKVNVEIGQKVKGNRTVLAQLH